MSPFNEYTGIVVTGLNYRVDWDDFEDTGIVNFDPASREMHLIDGFVEWSQDLSQTVSTTVASRVGHYYYTGLLVQPTARVAWKPTEQFTLWGASSYASRVPSTFDERSRSPEFAALSSPTQVFLLNGQARTDAEHLLSFELGICQQLFDKKGLIDISTFYNRYTDAISGFVTGVNPSPNGRSFQIGTTVINADGDIQSWGGELVFKYSPTDWLSTTLVYSNINKTDSLGPGAISAFGFDDSGYVEHVGSAWFNMRASESLAIDFYLRYEQLLQKTAFRLTFKVTYLCSGTLPIPSH